MNAYPAFLVLCDRPCVVIGGDAEAEAKVFGLLDVGASVTVIGQRVTDRLRRAIDRGHVAWRRRNYRRGDLRGAVFAVVTPEAAAVTHAVWSEAEDEHVLLNAMDDVHHCHVIAPAVHWAGDIIVAVSTAGKSPALAVRIRDRIARYVTEADGIFLRLLAALRSEIATRFRDAATRRVLWYRLVDSGCDALVRKGDVDTARAELRRIVDDHAKRHGLHEEETIRG